MANVMELLRKIKTAIYGRDVRQSIYDAILQCYQDATGNPESIAAHTGDTNNPHNVTAEQVGLAPVDGVTLSILDGFIKSIVTASGLKTKDTNGLLGEANTEVMLQALIDDITNRVVNQILTKSMLVNNGLTTESGKYPLDAAFGKTLADKDAELASSLAQLNSDFGFKQLWTGSWSSGSITCDISGYSVFKIICSSIPVAMIGMVFGLTLIAYGVDNNDSNASRIFSLKADISGETLTIAKNTILFCIYGGQNGSADTMTVTHIFGKR